MDGQMLSRDTLFVDSVSLLRTTPVPFGDAPNGRLSTFSSFIWGERLMQSRLVTTRRS